ncbi:DUF268 domain-containing protein [Patescibacteria group bacterium]|nr:DUF268 domain-containing protein [Patescibacteria group bacterium]
MRKFNNIYKDVGYLIYRWASPVVDPIKVVTALPNFLRYFIDMFIYSRLKGAEPISVINTYPKIHEKTNETSFDRHYFYQDIWAFKKIYGSKTKTHYDIGSNIVFVGFLTIITNATFVDIRPLNTTLDNFESIKGDICSLPFKNNSIPSLSCLHIAEHIGLGRYGDKLDPQGTKKACQELARVLAPGGDLYFSLPVGKPRLYFNSHRVHSPQQILKYFQNLKLVEFSGIDDEGKFIKNLSMEILENSDYACGLFWFKK